MQRWGRRSLGLGFGDLFSPLLIKLTTKVKLPILDLRSEAENMNQFFNGLNNLKGA